MQHVVAVVGHRRGACFCASASASAVHALQDAAPAAPASIMPRGIQRRHRDAVRIGRQRAAAAGTGRAARSRSLSSITCRGVASITSASRFTGVTAAAALMLRMMRCASTSTAALTVAPRPSWPSLLAPLRLVRVQHRRQRNRFADVHVHVAEILAQPPQRPQEPQQRFLFLGLARQLADVAVHLHDRARSRCTRARTPPGAPAARR